MVASTASRNTAASIEVGDVIMPPAREVRLWMRRHVAQKGLPETSLHLVVTEVVEAKADKGGRWLRIRTQHTDALAFNMFAFSFKARPNTAWQIIKKARAI